VTRLRQGYGAACNETPASVGRMGMEERTTCPPVADDYGTTEGGDGFEI
jgi:hypothetical protein